MNNRSFAEYKFKFYLNASHSITINGQQGQEHPHTWEMILDILVPRNEFLQFNQYERAINDYFKPFQNQYVNKIKPFDEIIPTLENLVDYFGDHIREIIRANGGELKSIEGSETPTRSYIVSYEEESDFIENKQKFSAAAFDRITNNILDDILS